MRAIDRLLAAYAPNMRVPMQGQSSYYYPAYTPQSTDEAASRAAQTTGADNTGTAVNYAPSFDGMIGGRRITIYGDGTPMSEAEVLEQLRTNHNWRNTGELIGTPGAGSRATWNAYDDPAFYAAINPNATPEQLAQQARAYNAHVAEMTPDGDRGIRGWMRDNPIGTIAAFGALAATGGALGGAFGGAGGAAGGAAGAGAAGSGITAGTVGTTGGALGAGATGAGLASALPEIVVTGTAAGSGLTGAGLASAGGAGLLAGNALTAPSSGNLGAQANSQVGSPNMGGGGLLSGLGANMSWMDWVGPLINTGASIYSGNQASDAIKDASKEGIAEQRRQFDQVRADTEPTRTLGAAAVDRIWRLYGHGNGGQADMSQFFKSPDFQFNLDETQKAIDRSAASRGGLLSGAAVREGERYASGLASREFSGFVDRLMQQAGLGNTGIGASAAAGANSANNISGILANSGANRASIYQNTGANVGSAINTGVANMMLRRYLGN